MFNTPKQGPSLNPNTPAFTSTRRRGVTEPAVPIKSVASLGGSPVGLAASTRRWSEPVEQPVARDAPIPLADIKRPTPAPTMTSTIYYHLPRPAPPQTQTTTHPAARAYSHTYPPTHNPRSVPNADQNRRIPIPLSPMRAAASIPGPTRSPTGLDQTVSQSFSTTVRSDQSSDTLASLYVHCNGATYPPASARPSPTETSAASTPGSTTSADSQRTTPAQRQGASLPGDAAGLDPFLNVEALCTADAPAAPSFNAARPSVIHSNDGFVARPSPPSQGPEIPPVQFRWVPAAQRGHGNRTTHVRNPAHRTPHAGMRSGPAHATRFLRKRTVTFDGLSPGMGPNVHSMARVYGRVVGWTSFPEPEAMQAVPPPANIQYHVVFERNEDAAACVTSLAGAAYMRVAFAQDQWRWEIKVYEDVNSNNLYISGVPLDMTEVMIHRLLAPYGLITSCRVHLDKFGHPRGLVFARLQSRRQAEAAIQGLNGTVYIDPRTDQPVNGGTLIVRIADCPMQKMLRDEKKSQGNAHGDGHSPVETFTPLPQLIPAEEMRRLIEERDRLLELLKRNEQEREALAPLVLNEAVALTGGIPTPPRGNFDQVTTDTTTGSTRTPPWRSNALNIQEQRRQQQQQQQQDVSDSSPESSKFVTPPRPAPTGIAAPMQGCTTTSPEQLSPNGSQSSSGSQASRGSASATSSQRSSNGPPDASLSTLWDPPEGRLLPAAAGQSGSSVQPNIWAPVPPVPPSGSMTQSVDTTFRNLLWPTPGA